MPALARLAGKRVRSSECLLNNETVSIWIATNAGVVRMDGQRMDRIGATRGLPDNQIHAILPDDAGGLWMSGNRGVFRVDIAALTRVALGLDERVHARRFDRDDGMPATETNGGFQPAGWRDSSGRLWFPTSSGAAIFDPGKIQLDRRPPPPSLRLITSDSQAFHPKQPLQLGPRPGRIELAYASPAHAGVRSMQYQYRLLGYEDGWYLTDDRRALLHRLPPGQFEFQVRARFADGDWSTSSVTRLTVSRHPLQNPWVWLLVAIVVIVAGAAWWRTLSRQRAARQQRLQEHQRLQAVGMLAGGIVHDFNNVLTVIMNGTELVADALPPNSAEREHAESVLHAAERGSGLTRQLLTFARGSDHAPRPLDLAHEINNMRDFLSRLMPGNIELAWHIRPIKSPCRINPIHLQQVVINLALNARDAMPGGGRLELELEPAASSMLPDRNKHSRPFVALHVSDTGTGISDEIRERLFEPFFTTKTAGEGTGLGLAVTYGIVSAAGGTIRISSRPGRGTRFTVVLPIDESADPNDA